MLGSIYLHTVSASLQGRVAGLENQLDTARVAGEQLEVDVAKLSAADRVRPLAREKLGMRDAGSADLEVFRNNQREDGKTNAGAEGGGGQR
jgi:cell division protein FtsL